MSQKNTTAVADDFIERAVSMLFRVIGSGTASSRAIPMVAAEMGVAEDELRDAYCHAFAPAGDAVAA